MNRFEIQFKVIINRTEERWVQVGIVAETPTEAIEILRGTLQSMLDKLNQIKEDRK